MNGTRYIPLISNFFDIDLIDDSISKVFHSTITFALSQIKNLARVLLRASWVVVDDLARVCLWCAYAVIFTVIISLVKSLRPKYNFCRRETSESEALVECDYETTPRSCLTSVYSPRPSTPTAQSLLDRLRRKRDEILQHSGAAITNSEAQQVYQGLSWSQTRVDIERVRWINQTLLTLWPCIKTIVNKILIGGVIKQKTKRIPAEARKLKNKQTKLTLYLSCRRKLDLLRDFRRKNLAEEQKGTFQKGFNKAVFIFLKLILVYFKQFVIDTLMAIGIHATKKLDDDEKSSAHSGIARLIDISRPSVAVKHEEKTGAKSWAGFDLQRSPPIGSGSGHESALKSAPAKIKSSHASIKRMTVRPSRIVGSKKFIQKRKQLANFFKRAINASRPKEPTIERIKLGRAIPQISGLKFLDKDAKHTGSGDGARSGSILVYKVLSDDSCIRILSEVTYESDKNLNIRLSSLPILDRVCLVKLKFQFRFLITLNHTTTELNRDLKIFHTPHDVLFPMLNYVQLTLLDTPRLDWAFEKVPFRQKLRSMSSRRFSPKEPSLRNINCWNSLVCAIKRRIDIILIINNSYVKFLVHSMIRLCQKWFQPFDIKIGDKFYLKTIQ